jgi:hypothetical protein
MDDNRYLFTILPMVISRVFPADWIPSWEDPGRIEVLPTPGIAMENITGMGSWLAVIKEML